MANQEVSPSAGVKQPRFYYGNIIVLASFFVVMIAWGTQYSFGVFFKPVLNEFGWTRAETSGAYSLSIVLLGFFGIIAGRLSDKYGPRLVVTGCGLLLGLGYILMSQLSAIWQIYLFYGVLASIGVAGSWVPLLSTIARWFVRRRGLASGIVAAGIGIGTIILPLLANKLISVYNWRTSFIIIGIISLVVYVVIAQFLRRDPAQMGLLAYGAQQENTENASREVSGFSLKEAIHTRQFWIISVTFFFFAFCLQTVMVHIVPYATDAGISADSAAILLSIIGFVSIGSKLGLGGAGDRIGNKRVILTVFILLLAAFFLLQSTSKAWTLTLFAVVFGLGYGGLAAVQSPTVAEFFELKEHGAIFGLVMFITHIGGAIGPLAAGRIFDITGSYYWAFMLCALLSLISIITTLFLKPTRKALG